MTARYVPIIAVIDEALVHRLNPLIASLAARFANNPDLDALMTRNGWTPDTLAWGSLINALADDLDVDAILDV